MKHLTAIFIISIFFLDVSFSQLRVTEIPQKKQAVIEHFTGTSCGGCPAMHKRAKEIRKEFPRRVILMNYHVLTTPNAGRPDYRTDDGSSFADSISTNPFLLRNGLVNRRIFDNQITTNYEDWESYSETVLDETAIVNIGAVVAFDSTSRKLTINTKLLYTRDSDLTDNRLRIVMLQDSIIGPQVGGVNNPADLTDGSRYYHSDMYRESLTGSQGILINDISRGSEVVETISYDLPEQINGIPLIPEHCHFVIFVTDGLYNIQQAIDLRLNQSTHGVRSSVYIDTEGLDKTALNSTSEGEAVFNAILYADAFGFSDYTVDIEFEGPESWFKTLAIANRTFSQSNIIKLFQGSINDLRFRVIPSEYGVGRYKISIYPVDFPDSKVEFNLTVVHDCTDLIVNGESLTSDYNSFPILDAGEWEDYYTSAFSGWGIENIGNISSTELKALKSNNDIENVQNLYLNIGWTFPAYTDEMVNVLKPFMENGGNVFMSGQDITWDITRNGGSTLALDFLNNYMNVQYREDGSTSNNPITPISNGLFFDYSSIELFNYYNHNNRDNFYPDLIRAYNDGQPAFSYHDSDLIAGSYSDNGTSRTVFFGFGLEMVKSTAARANLMKRVYDYFHGEFGSEEKLARNFDIRVLTNPVSRHKLLLINNSNTAEWTFNITDISGRKVFSSSTSFLGVNTYDVSFESGLYFVNYFNGNLEKSEVIIVE